MLDRRTFLFSGAAAALASPSTTKIAVFSKHLQFLEGEALAEAAAAIGFDGIDITVRPKGHIEPERAGTELPKLVKTIRARGLEVPMVTAGIVDADTPHAESVLKTLSDLGIRYYRWGGFRYNNKDTVARQLEALKPRVARLEALNRKHGLCAMYHTHSGAGQVGASIWDIHSVLSGFDPGAVSINYDIGHATIEGGLGGWINSFGICGPYLRGVALKDFRWEQKNAKWNAEWTPIGEGMVKFEQFFGMLDRAAFDGPLQLHFEYDLGGADEGKTQISIPKEQIYGAMKRDLARIRSYRKPA